MRAHSCSLHPTRMLTLPSLSRLAGGALLAKPDINSITTSKAEALGANEKSAAAVAPLGTIAGACAGAVKASNPAALQVTAGTAEVFVNPKGKVKKFGAPLGVRVDILTASAALSSAAAPACRIKVPGAIKAGATRTRQISAGKLTACYTALKLVDCSQQLQVRATAIAGKKFKEGAASTPVKFKPSCAPCSG
jgi:hypothetical protein